MNVEVPPGPAPSLHTKAALVVVAAVVLAWLPVVTGAESIYHLDRYFEHAPFQRFAVDAVRAGELPFWSPEIRTGYPIFANGEASLCHPLTWLLASAFEPHRALDLFTLLHVVLGGWSCFAYLRELRQPSSIALLGALGFALGGRMLGTSIWANAVAAAACLPLLLFGIERTRRAPRAGCLWIALAVGLGLLAGRPQLHALNLLLGVLYALFRLERGPARRPQIRGLLLGAGLGLLLGSVQALPTLLFVEDTSRAAGLGWKAWSAGAIGVDHLGELLLPAKFGWPEAYAFPGFALALGVLLALASLRWRRDPLVLFFLAIGAGAVYVACAGPGAYTTLNMVPVLRGLSGPVRFLHLASFAVVILGALGWGWAVTRWPRARRLLPAVAVYSLVELTATSRITLPTAPAQVYEARPFAVERLKATDPTGSPWRFGESGFWVLPHELDGLGPAEARARFEEIPPARDLALVHGLRAALGYGEPIFTWQEPTQRRARAADLRQQGARFFFAPSPDWMRRAGLGRFRLVARSKAAYLFEDPGALPRALVVPQVRYASSAREAYHLASSPSFDPRSLAVVESVPSAEPARGTGTARVVRDARNSLEIEVEAPRGGYLLVFDVWAPGWSAQVSGQSVPLERANGIYRLTEVPPGRSRVEFRYRPPGLVAGGCLSALGLLLVLVVACARKSKQGSAGWRASSNGGRDDSERGVVGNAD